MHVRHKETHDEVRTEPGAIRRRVLLVGLMMVTAGFAVACGNGDAGGTGPPAGTGPSVSTVSPVVSEQPSPSGEAAATIEGGWDGTWTSTSSPGATGTFHIEFTRSGTHLTGSITIANTPCITTGTITGALHGNRIDFGAVQGAQTIAYTGAISGTSMSGTYAAPQCDHGVGEWQATAS